ncbi:putative ataxin 2, SM domain-containing protein [Helianthus annuus]|nr:putative ataxin 2, SM domain-containing protein [Helianthus annuus]
MGCRNGEEDRSSSSSSGGIVNDVLLLTSMCLIGLSVDVHIKDGSVYSGIFHTASVHHPYAIVLKRAKMTKKGSCNSNVANEEVIRTLIIQSEDLVQVVAKKVTIPADGFAGHGTGDETGAVACSFPSNGISLTESNKTMTGKSNVGQPHTNQTRCSSGTENGFANGCRPPVNTIRSTDTLEVKDIDAKDSTKKENCLKDPDDNRKYGNHTSSSAPSETVTTKISNSNPTTKEFKLNPGAKIFSPSFPNKRSATPQAMVTGTNLVYNPDTHPSGPQPEVEISPFAPRSVPVKFVPYAGNDVHHPPPIVGYMTNRSQPARYGSYHPVQTAPTYVQPSSQNVMVGRLGPVVYVHPVSQDMVPSTNSFSSVLTPHQLHVPKHQGTTAGQALQLSPFVGGGQAPPYVLPGHIPISQLPYPVISIPGSNGFLVSKFS